MIHSNPQASDVSARSFLFVPGDRPERIAKAWGSGADNVIVDLEDAVPPRGKDAARAALFAALTPAAPVLVRINGADTPWFEQDLAMCHQSGVAGIVLPKAERVEDLDRVAAVVGRRRPIHALIETAAGLWNAMAIAQHAAVARLLFGSIDLQLDLGIGGDDDELDAFRSQLVLVSRLARLPAPVDGVTVTFDDPEPVRADALRARRFGFGAKLCIHPRQIAVVNAAFSPTVEELRWAERVLEAVRQSNGAAVALDGRMIDRPVVLRAEAILRARRDDGGADAEPRP